MAHLYASYKVETIKKQYCKMLYKKKREKTKTDCDVEDQTEMQKNVFRVTSYVINDTFSISSFTDNI